MDSHKGRRVSLIEVILIGVVVGAISCEGGGAGGSKRGVPAASANETAVSELTTAKTTAGDQARAAAYANRAAIYRQISNQNKQAIAALATAAPARAKRQAAADLADRMAAGAQKAADFYTQKATDTAAQTAAGLGGGQ